MKMESTWFLPISYSEKSDGGKDLLQFCPGVARRVDCKLNWRWLAQNNSSPWNELGIPETKKQTPEQTVFASLNEIEGQAWRFSGVLCRR